MRQRPMKPAAAPAPHVTRRQVLAWSGGAAAAMIASPGRAQHYPNRAIKIVVPFGAGGSTDAMARILSQRLSEVLKQAVTVENRAGAAGAIGADAVAKSPGDGYSLLISTSSTHAVLPHLRPLPYDAQKDFTPVALLARAPNILVASPALKVDTAEQLFRSSKARAGQLSFSSSGQGTITHLIVEAILQRAGIKATHVPYKTGVQALADIASGQVDFACDSIVWTLPQARAGKIKALAITSLQRSALAPELPTLAESGFRGFDGNTWFGVMAPKGVPEAITADLNRHINQVLNDPVVRKQFEAQGAEAGGGSPADFNAMVQQDSARWASVIAKGQIKLAE